MKLTDKKLSRTHRVSDVILDPCVEYLRVFCYMSGSGYAQLSHEGKDVYLHRLLMNAGKGQVVDHINGNTLDNRFCNLRIGTQYDNMHNVGLRKDNSSGYKGVRQHEGGLWQAKFTFKGKRIYCGSYLTAREAAIAYNNEAVKHLGAKAILNEV